MSTIINDKKTLKDRLSKESYEVTQNGATERAFTGTLLDEKRTGVYQCICCQVELFASDVKFESSTGWPSFYAPVDAASINEKRDVSLGMVRTEVMCGKCDAHLGHVFPDGPKPTGLRYCINSASLDFKTKNEV